MLSLLTSEVMPVLFHLSTASYEIHLSEAVRRKGLGKFLMQTLELLAARYFIGIQMCVFSFTVVQLFSSACGPTQCVPSLSASFDFMQTSILLLFQNKDEEGGLDSI